MLDAADELDVEIPIRSRQHGFTLIELMIVVAILAIVASLSVPNLLASGSIANENVTLGTLRTLSTAQFRFKTMALVDGDRSGSYEYGTLPELAGIDPVRQTGEQLAPALVPASLGMIDGAGTIRRQGYLYALYLPDASGAGLAATPANLAAIDPRNAESAFTVLAWPASYGQSGRVTFFVNEQGEILKSMTARYSGAASAPPPGAGLAGVPPTAIVGGWLAANMVGSDGNTWIPVR